MSPTKRKKLQAAHEVISLLAEVDESMPLRKAMMLLLVAAGQPEGAEKMSAAELEASAPDLDTIAEKMDVSGAQAGRDLDELGERTRKLGAVGPRLVEKRMGYRDQRKRYYFLTKKGAALIDRISEAV